MARAKKVLISEVAAKAQVNFHGAVEWLREEGLPVAENDLGLVINHRDTIKALAILRKWKAARRSVRQRFSKPTESDCAAALLSTVYFIECDGFVKIGLASSVEERLSGIATANPHPVRLLLTISGDQGTESGLHRRFAQYRHRGEWFRHEGELASHIALTAAAKIPSQNTTALGMALEALANEGF